MGRPVSVEENLISSSTRAKSCFACSGLILPPVWDAAAWGGAAVTGGWAKAIVAAKVNAAATAHPRPSLLDLPFSLLINSPNLL
jgi:hypothetical protein